MCKQIWQRSAFLSSIILNENYFKIMTTECNGEVILATGGYDHTVKLWNVKNGVNQRTYQHPQTQVNALEVTADKQLIAAAGYQQILMYELNAKSTGPTASFEGVTKNVTGLGFQEDAKWIYTGGEDMSARIWDIRSRNLHCQKMFQVSAPVTCVRLHPNQTELVVGDQSGIIHLWDLNNDNNEQLIPETDASIQDINIDASGSYMAAVNNKGHCYIWSLSRTADEPTRLNPKHKIEAHSRYGLKCRFNRQGTLLVTTSADHTARIWRTTDFTLVQELKTEAQRWVWGAAFSLDSRYLVTASSDGLARLWDIATATVKREYSGHQKAVTALAFADQAI